MAQQAFQHLKQVMTQAPVLATPNFSLLFTIQTDASGYAMGVVLLQEDHPIAYYSKVLCPRLQRALTYVRELHAITSSVRKWCHYLLGTSFTILTDHKSLRDLMSQVIQTPEQQTYLSKLLGYDYTIKYKPGFANVVADALSRLFSTEVSCLSLIMPHFTFLHQLRHTLLQDPQYVDLLHTIKLRPDAHSNLAIHKDLIFRQGCI